MTVQGRTRAWLRSRQSWALRHSPTATTGTRIAFALNSQANLEGWMKQKGVCMSLRLLSKTGEHEPRPRDAPEEEEGQEVLARRTLAGRDRVCEVGVLRPDRFDHEGDELPSAVAGQSGSSPGDWRGATPKSKVDGRREREIHLHDYAGSAHIRE